MPIKGNPFLKQNQTKLKSCPMQHENGNCLPCGGFCTSIHPPLCKAMQNAYLMGADDTKKDLADWLNRNRRADNDR